MKQCRLLLLICGFFFMTATTSFAQCSICSRTAAQMGERPAKALNSGILYLAFAPIAIIGLIGYRWYKNNRLA